MTSRISFSNRMKEDRKRRIWTIVLFACLCLIFIVAFELVFENMNNMLQSHTIIKTDYRNNMIHVIGKDAVPFYLLISGIGAMLFGFQGFGWLMKKQQVDFYHSLPITRTERFFIIYFNGILFFLIPLLIHTGLVALLIGVRGVLTKTIAVNMMTNLGLYLIAFLLMYHLVILAVMMTGNILVSFLGAFTFLFYASALRTVIVDGYYAQYFKTYYGDEIFRWLSYLSPFERILRVFELRLRWIDGNRAASVLILVAMTAIVFCLAWKLYLLRPLERTGKALIFPKTGNVIRVLIVIPISMVSSLIFSMAAGEKSTLWSYIGCVIGVVFFHGFMEVIFHFDIKAAFRKKIQLAATLVAALVIISIFQFDLLGYDRYLPNTEKLKAVSFAVDLAEMDKGYNYKIGEDGVPTGAYLTDTIDYQLTHSKTENVEGLYELIKASMEEGIQQAGESEVGYQQFIVSYELKSGKKVMRQYKISRKIMEEKFTPLFEAEAEKEILYPILKLSANNVEKVNCTTPFMKKTLEYSQEEMEELLNAYQTDIREKNFSQYLQEKTLGEVSFEYRREGIKDTMEISMDVTNTCKHTLEYLKQKGTCLELPNDEYEITQMRISNWTEDYVDDNVTVEETSVIEDNEFWNGKQEVTLTKEQIRVIAPIMVSEFYQEYETLKPKIYAFGIEVMLKNRKTGVTQQLNYVLAKEDAPDFLVEKAGDK